MRKSPNALLYYLSALLFVACVHPKAMIQADVDPHFDFRKPQDIKLFIALKDQSIEEKKFSYFLNQELEKKGFTITADDERADFQLIYALDLENYKTKEYILLSNPEFISGNINGRSFTAQKSAYQYAPIERAYAYKQVFLDLYQKRKDQMEKVWSGMLKIENDDYRKHTEACVQALVNVIGKDANQKVSLKY